MSKLTFGICQSWHLLVKSFKLTITLYLLGVPTYGSSQLSICQFLVKNQMVNNSNNNLLIYFRIAQLRVLWELSKESTFKFDCFFTTCWKHRKTDIHNYCQIYITIGVYFTWFTMLKQIICLMIQFQIYQKEHRFSMTAVKHVKNDSY